MGNLNRFLGTLNNITSNELNHLTGIDYNIKQRIYDNNINQSNYVINISNILNTDYNRAVDGLKQMLWGLFKKIVILYLFRYE